MSHNQECYRYAAPGERSLKRHYTHQSQQVRYLQGLEIRTSTTRAREAARLQVLGSGNCRIYLQGSDTRTHFNLCDRLGNISLVMDAQGARVSQETWYPFGGTASWLTGNQAGAEIKFQRYAGKERDATGLIAYGWRYYAPWQMRWLNCDPAGTVDGLNLFRMVSNNPVTLFDRDGRMEDELLLQAIRQSSFEDVPASLQSLEPQIATAPEPGPSTSGTHAVTVDNAQHYSILRKALTIEPPQAELLAVVDLTDETSQSTASEPAATVVKNKYVCSHCAESFSALSALRNHGRMEHPTEGHLCSHARCGKKFDTKSKLNKHVRIVHGEKAFACDWPSCDSRFTNQAYLTNHKKIHAAREKLLCSYPECNKYYTTPISLKIHAKTHQEQDKLLCLECGAAFKNKGNLTRHQHRNCPFRPSSSGLGQPR
ncbi:RHS repeat-associated core domain-containing protein [Pantoea sp. At-9b]|uniref:RHS repeat-associated core domain-containing protein n=1 Tax=Pantoea sp. (strain At-9b) TaxID=592316 RepID=UPI0001B3FA9F|nr:RHS repeat-associated core domain-containing protein [Pantoea sp. At-9b]ADU71392.1 zinc finger C2H2-type domain protein [Pantoea sp. At-9b]